MPISRVFFHLNFQDADEEKDVPEEKDVEVDEEASVISTANPAMTKRKLSQSVIYKGYNNLNTVSLL